MRKLLQLLLIGVLGLALVAGSSNTQTKWYVIAITGAELHVKPAFKSKIVRRIPVGTSVNVQETIASEDVKQIGAGFALPGDWVKVTTPEYVGYIFSSDLTETKPAVRKNKEGMPYIDLLGARKSRREEKQKVVSGNKNESIQYADKETIEYANSLYTMTSFDGCFDHVYTFRRLALHEVYHHMINSYADYEFGKLVQPKLLTKKGNVYTFTCGFGGSAAQELKLTVHKNGVIIVSSYDCT